MVLNGASGVMVFVPFDVYVCQTALFQSTSSRLLHGFKDFFGVVCELDVHSLSHPINNQPFQTQEYHAQSIPARRTDHPAPNGR